jgi:hypothetical protein
MLLTIATNLNSNPATESRHMIMTLADYWSSTADYRHRFRPTTCNEQWHFSLAITSDKSTKTEPDAQAMNLPNGSIDDQKLEYYNRIIANQITGKDWNRTEGMHRYTHEGVYEFGIHIKHNYAIPIPGGGSCFFIHVHHKSEAPTAGNTAFAREQVKDVFDWLNPNKKLLIVAQFPVAVFNALKQPWGLPAFDHTPI